MRRGQRRGCLTLADVEGNGPDDLSSTLRYQRDSFTDWLRYLADFVCNAWWKLPLYFYRHGRRRLAVRAFVTELGSFVLLATAISYRPRPAIVLFLLPLVQMVRRRFAGPR